jgi:hypothetical protein
MPFKELASTADRVIVGTPDPSIFLAALTKLGDMDNPANPASSLTGSAVGQLIEGSVRFGRIARLRRSSIASKFGWLMVRTRQRQALLAICRP